MSPAHNLDRPNHSVSKVTAYYITPVTDSFNIKPDFEIKQSIWNPAQRRNKMGTSACHTPVVMGKIFSIHVFIVLISVFVCFVFSFCFCRVYTSIFVYSLRGFVPNPHRGSVFGPCWGLPPLDLFLHLPCTALYQYSLWLPDFNKFLVLTNSWPNQTSLQYNTIFVERWS